MWFAIIIHQVLLHSSASPCQALPRRRLKCKYLNDCLFLFIVVLAPGKGALVCEYNHMLGKTSLGQNRLQKKPTIQNIAQYLEYMN